MVFLVNRELLLDLRVEVVADGFQELELSLVFFLDFLVELLLLKLLVFDIVQQVLLDCPLELVEVVDFLCNPVDGVFKSADVDLVCLDLNPSHFDHFLHLLLVATQTVHQVAQLRVGLVELAQLFVHLIRVHLQVHDFLLSRRNILFQFFDLVVQHILEFFKLLSLLFQLIDFLFALANVLVFLGQLSVQMCKFLFLIVDILLLLIYLSFPVLLGTFQLFIFVIDVNQLVPSELALCSRLQLHIVHCSLVVGVLRLDVFNLVVRVLLDRLQGCFIPFAGSINVFHQLRNLSVAELHFLTVLLALHVNDAFVLLATLDKCLFKFSLLFLFSQPELFVPRSVCKHLG